MAPSATPGLEADDDPAFVRRAAAVGRAARWGVALAVALAALGVFGGAGPLVQAEAGGAGGLAVVYDRFARLDAPLALRVGAPGGLEAVTLEGDLASALRLDAVTPSPTAEAATEAGVRYAVAVGSGGSVAFRARPLRFGVLRGAVSLPSGDRAEVRILVYP